MINHMSPVYKSELEIGVSMVWGGLGSANTILAPQEIFRLLDPHCKGDGSSFSKQIALWFTMNFFH